MTTLEVTYGSSDLIEVTYGAADEVTIRYAGVAGPQGPTGATGPAGADGVGVPVGGTTGQVLAKASGTDYDTEWASLGWKQIALHTVSVATEEFTLSPSFTGYKMVRITGQYWLSRVSVNSRSSAIQLNGETGNDYEWTRLSRSGASSGGANAAATDRIVLGPSPADLQDRDVRATFEVIVSVSDGYRGVFWTHQGSSTGGSAVQIDTGAGWLKKTDALTSITFTGLAEVTRSKYEPGSFVIVEAI